MEAWILKGLHVSDFLENGTASPGIQVAESKVHAEKAVVLIEYYTDPLCSWSWAFEAQWRRLRYEYAGQLDWRYRMGGLLPDWSSYADPLNEIHSPAQMGPQWFQVSAFSGMPLNPRLWQTNPPDSSYPACLAVKAAERQGQACAENYLRRLREAALLEGRNIARPDELFALADEVGSRRALQPFDSARLCEDYAAPATMEALRQDLREAAYADIGRFPTLLLHHHDGHSLILVGYRPYAALQDALEHLDPHLARRTGTPPTDLAPADLALAYTNHWGTVTAREVAEILAGESAQAEELLEDLVRAGKLARTRRNNCSTPLYAPC